MTQLLWGIDLGGTKTECVVLDPSSPETPIHRQRRDTNAHLGYRAVVETISTLLQDVAKEVGSEPTMVGIGTPGALRPGSGVMMNCNTTCLNGQPLQRDLEEVLGYPVRLANDANCFALAEAKMGAAKGAECVFGVILGTGVGGGLVVDGKVWNGRQGIAGEWGHNVLDPEGRECYCGNRGCVETVLSGPSLAAWHKSHTGEDRTYKEIASHPEDPGCAKTLDRLYEEFGRAIAVVINILDPEVIVLGGGVGQTPDLEIRGLDAARKWIFQPDPDVSLVKPSLGDSAGVFGAAFLTVSR